MRSEVGAAYDASAAAWRGGPEAVYARLAAALVDHAPIDLAGARVLDAGAGTGVGGRAALDRGAAVVVAGDLATRMLPGPPVLGVAADLLRLPFRDSAFDLAVAGFTLSHVEAPDRAVAELRRVADALVASAFAPGMTHPAKNAVDAAMARFGFTAPAWYQRIKDAATDVEGEGALAGLARDAGFRSVQVVRMEVDTGVSGAGLARWRLGMAHLAPFLATLSPDDRALARREAERAVAGMPPLVVSMLALSAR